MSTQPYCLFCYSPLPESSICPRCGRASPEALRRSHWSLEPRLVRLERGLKAASVILVIAVAIVLAVRIPSFATLSPLAGFIAVALFETISRLTKHRRLFLGRFFWVTVFLLAGVALTLAGHPALALGCVAMAGACLVIGGRFDAWRRRRIAQGAAA